MLIRCIAQPLGFSKGRPVAACIIYKCLRHWRSFEVERASIFDRIIQTIGHAIEVYICYLLRHCYYFKSRLQSNLDYTSFIVDTRRQQNLGILVIKCIHAAVLAATYTKSECCCWYDSTTSAVTINFIWEDDQGKKSSYMNIRLPFTEDFITDATY